jgi:L-ascorbate metabolism protein UlaG (beta-lactamase superfamily)
VKPAFQKDGAFLAEIKRALDESRQVLWWLGQSGFLWVQNGRALVLDPYLSDSLTRKYAGTDKPHTRITEMVIAPAMLGSIGVIDLICSSHNHTDHLDVETLVPLLETNPQGRLAISAANKSFVLDRLESSIQNRLVQLDDKTSAQVGSIDIHGIAAAHPTVERDTSGRCLFLGYVIKSKEVTIYHSGDTLLHDDLAPSLKPFKIDVALLPINGDLPQRRVAGNLDGKQAAQLAKAIGASLVIPCHYDMFEFNTANPEMFVAECKRLDQPFHILRNGEGLRL